jgi:hypothetical protein
MPTMYMVLIVLVAVLLPTNATSREAAPRYGLVIGNHAYKTNITELKNPLNDISAVATALDSIGIEVQPPERNATRAKVISAVTAFATQVGKVDRGAGNISFLYYSGHGFSVGDKNYLLTIDATSQTNVDLGNHAVDVDDIVTILTTHAPRASHYVVFDACRSALPQGKGSARGWVEAAKTQGVFVVFAAANGEPASDDGDFMGPFAEALVVALNTPGLDDQKTFNLVREHLIARTFGRQRMDYKDGITGAKRHVFNVAAAERPKPLPDVALRLKPGEKHSFIDCAIYCPRMVVVPALGRASTVESESTPSLPQRSQGHAPFAVGKFEVTVGEWMQCVAAGDCKVGPPANADPSHPMSGVSWIDTATYLSWLKRMSGRDYRLLTDAEWKHVARAGGSTSSPPMPPQPADANFRAPGRRSYGQVRPVGSYAANGWGLHDSYGNVWEWVQDCFDGQVRDRFSIDCLSLVRGGGWSETDEMRNFRRSRLPGNRDEDVGFRVARDIVH